MSLVNSTFDAVLPHLRPDSLVVINSQIPVGSTERWQRKASETRPSDSIDVVYSPENLRLGQAIELFKKPDMIVIGTGSEQGRQKAERFFKPFECEKIFVSWRTAEMAKHALNAFFATSISFANEIGSLCDRAGADGVEIAQILKKDSRIGKKAQVRPGLGFAGATLARDLKCLENLGRRTGTPTPFIESVLAVNQKQKHRVIEILEGYFNGELKNKILAAFGLTYKPGTSTLRRSVSLEIIELLHRKGCIIHATDPQADLNEIAGEMNFEFYKDPYECSKGSSGILLLTEWPEYKELDYGRICSAMSHALIFDTKNFLDNQQLEKLGFHYLGLGRGQVLTQTVRK